jgi:C4-dicarboxylate-specific signal transduction histidine kinase
MMETSELRMLALEEVEALAVLARISRAINASYNVDETLSAALDAVVEALQVGRAAIMLASETDARPRIVVARGIDPHSWELDAFEYSRTVVARAWESGESLLANDALNDARLSKIESLRRLRTRSLMCVPMRVRGATTGIIYADNEARANLFSSTDLRLLEVIADLAAAAVERARYYVDLQLQKKPPSPPQNGLLTLGRHARAVSHDFNNIATIIKAHCDAAHLHLQAGRTEQVDNALAGIETACAHAHALTRLLINHAERSASEPEQVDVNRRLSDMEAFLRVVIGPGHDLRIDPFRGPAVVRLAPLELEQIVFNLAVNARNAMPSRGVLTVETRAEKGMLVLRVSDTGRGMGTEILRRVTDGESTGVGLRVIREILERRGGAMEVESAEEKGAAFEIALPMESVESPG